MAVIIPIGHDQTVRRLPWVTIAIIAACTLVQFYAQFMAPSAGELRHILEAHQFATGDSAAALERQALELLDKMPLWRFGYHTDAGPGISLVTSAFVHAGWFHLVGNMLFLWLAGSVLEDRWGRLKYFVFYICGAVAANLAFKAMYHGDGTILVGASGAISATMGAFLYYNGSTEITFWYWLMMRTGTFRVAAYFALPLWLGEQILWAFLERQGPGLSGVAYTAHIGGFVFGLGFAIVSGMIFGRGDPDADGPPVAVARPAAATGQSRYDMCMDAIKRRDLATVRTLASRTILDLSRAGDHAGILTMYRAIAANLSSVPLTDGAFVAATVAVDATGDADGYVEIANAFDREQPGSMQLPRVLWRLAQHHRDAGRIDLAVRTLESLAGRFAHDPFGIQAREALDKRR